MTTAKPNGRLRLLALTTDGVGGHGGIARYNGDLIGALAQSGRFAHIDVFPRVSPASPPPLPPTVQQHVMPASRAGYVAAVARDARGRFAIDIVFCGHINLLPLAAAVARARGARLWLQIHGIDAWTPPGRLHRAASAGIHLVTAVSRHTRARFLAWSNIDPDRVRVLPNTFDPRFTPGPKPAALAARYDLGDRKVLLTVARLSAAERYKGHDRVIAALPRLAALHPSIAYLVVGDGDDRPRLERISREAGVADRVVFAGVVADDALADHYRLADVFVMPSDGEGFGIVFLEAAAMGLPVIAGNCDGSVDALADGADGLLVDPHAPDAIVAAIDRALRSPPARALPDRFAGAAFAAHVAGLVDLLVAMPSSGAENARAA